MSPQEFAIFVLLGSFLAMIVLRFPIAYAVALSSMLCLGVQGLSLATVCQQMVKGISSYSLMAVPFFITMGVFMGSGGISDKLVALANSLVGWMRGGLLALSLMIGSYIISVKRNYPKGDPFSLIGLIKQLGQSIWAAGAIFIVVVGVVMGLFTATESAAIAVFYSLFVSLYVYKGLDWKGVWNELSNAVNTLAIVMILIATSSAFGYCLTTLHVPELAANLILGITDNKIVLAILLNLILLFLGMIMDMAPIILITTPILLPIAQTIGIDPIQYGIMLMLNCGIGLLTPPVGSVLFIGAAVAKRPIGKVVKATLPFYLCMVAALLLITFIPDISLLLPKLFSGYVPTGTGLFG